MPKIFGNFIEAGDTQEYLIISSSALLLPMQERWHNYSLSADFLASYWGTFFPAHTTESGHRRAEVQDAVSYIANELLENAIKFSYEPVEIPVKIGIYLTHDRLRFYVTNSVNPQTVGEFQQYIQTVLTEDPGELYIRQLERNASDEHSIESRLGFLTLLNDYEVELAWKFEHFQQNSENVIVTTMVELEIVRAQ